LERQRSQTLAQMIAELDAACTTGTKKNAQGYHPAFDAYHCVYQYDRHLFESQYGLTSGGD
jgi:hypothetical protein